MIDIICALCGKKQQTEILYKPTLKEEKISSYAYSARRFPDKLHYRILRCKRCGLIFSSPIFNPLQITKLYRESYCKYDEQIPFVTKTYLGLFERVRQDLPKKPKVLEVGCGNGFFLKKLKERGIDDLYGIEPSPKMASKIDEPINRANIKIDIFRKNQFSKNLFDLILCFHTLDHMVDPNEFIDESYRLLKNKGMVIVVVHDTKGLSVKLFGEGSPIFDIEHIYLFNKKTLREIFIRSGFEIIDTFDIVNTYPLSYWFRMSGLPSFLKNIGQRILLAAKLSKINLSLAGGNIGIIARKA